MIEYQISVNNGVEAFGTEGKTITVNEVLRTADIKALAREIHHENGLIPQQVAEDVLQNFAKASVNLMSQGFAIQFKNGNDVMMRIYPDVKIKGGNINLTRAQQLDPTVTEITTENAGDLVSKAGVVVRAYAECEKKFTDMLLNESSGIERVGTIERAKIMLNGNSNEEEENTGGNTNNNTNNGGSDVPPDNG